MAIRTDDQLLDGTYGTTNPIQPDKKITAERHRDIIQSKANRLNFGDNPDETTAEGVFVSETRSKLEQLVLSVNGNGPDENGDVEVKPDWEAEEEEILNQPFKNLSNQFIVNEDGTLSIVSASDIYYIQGYFIIEPEETFTATLQKLGDETFSYEIEINVNQNQNNSDIAIIFETIYFISADETNFSIINTVPMDKSKSYFVAGNMLLTLDDDPEVVSNAILNFHVFDDQRLLTDQSGVILSVNNLNPDENGNVTVPIPQAGTGIETTFDPSGNPVFNMMPQILFAGPFDLFEDLPEEGLSNTIYLVGETSPYEMWFYTESWVSLGGLDVDLTGVVKSVNELLPDASGNVTVPVVTGPPGDDGEPGPPGPPGPKGEGQEFIVNKYTEVWAQATGSEFDVDLKDFRFKLIRQSNGTYLAYLQNTSENPISFFWRYSDNYDSSSSGGAAVNAAVTLNPGDISSYISNNTSGLGYGNYPNTVKIEIINVSNGDKYVWESMASGRGTATSGGVINSVLTIY